MEAQRVKAAQASRGQRVRFTYADYAVKVLLGPILRKYFNLDQSGRVGYQGVPMMPAVVTYGNSYSMSERRDTSGAGCCGCVVQ